MNDPTPNARYEALLQTALQTVRSLKARVRELEAADEPIAIVGMGCRLPGGVGSPEEFFAALMAGVDAVGAVPADRWTAGSGTSEVERASGWGAFIDGAFRFDASFFGISEVEAAAMDPQQRLALEVVHDAVTHAGYTPASLAADTGVFMGIMNSDYIHELLRGGADTLDVYATTGNGHCFLPGRLSYQFGWTGPSLAVDTACSSSLVAVQLACESLRRRECAAAVAGGVHVMVSPQVMAMTAKTGTLSPEGRCRSFDARANGIVRGEGCGIVVLKRIADAQRDGDAILAVIRGGATNQDGRSTNLTAPNVLSQEALLRAVVERAGVVAGDVAYVETHGTGTPLGDPIEVEAIQQVYARERRRPCVLGAVKTNIGHLEAAAGIAGLIKAVMVLRRGVVPPNLHFRRLNPRIELPEDLWVVPTRPVPLAVGEGPRLAAVSSFGLSGTNAHVIVEAGPRAPVGEAARVVRALPLAASSATGLARLARRWRGLLDDADDAALDDACWTASGVARPGSHRVAVVARDRAELLAKLAEIERAPGDAAAPVGGGLAFMFTGQGSQYAGMGRELIEREPVVRATLERCDAILSARLGASLFDLLDDADRLHETRFTQPLLFALELAGFELWRSWGVEPDVLLGHSLGEYVAAHVAGVWSLADALALVHWRGELMQRTREGAMLSLEADEDTARELVRAVGGVLSLAAVNAAAQVVVAGDRDAVARLQSMATERGVAARRLQVTRAFHSALMDPTLAEFERRVEQVASQPPNRPVIGNLTGTPVERFDAAYLSQHLRGTVRFAAGLRYAFEQLGVRRFVEVGPHPVLCAFGARDLAAAFIPTMRRGEDSAVGAVTAAAALYGSGFSIDLRRLYAQPRRRFCLPPSSWEGPELRRRPVVRRAASTSTHGLLGERLRVPGAAVHWSRTLTQDDPAALAEHRVHGRPLVPAASFVELVLAAAAALGLPHAIRIEALTVTRPLWLTDEPIELVTTAAPGERPGSWGVGFSSAPAGEQRFVEHAHAIVGPASVPSLVDVTGLAAARERCSASRTVDPMFAALDAAGVELGPGFRRLERATGGGGGALVGIRPLTPGEPAASLGRTVLYDACLQACGLALDREPDPARVRVPARVRSIDVVRPTQAPAWAYARASEDGELDVEIFDVDAEHVASLRGVELMDLPKPARGRESIAWRIRWRAQPVAARAGVDEPGRWLLFDGGAAVVSTLVAGMTACQQRCIRVGRPEHVDAILRTLDDAIDQALREGPLAGVIYAWHLGSDAGDDPIADQRWAAIGAAQCAQRLARAGGVAHGRLWFVTRGAVAAGDDDPLPAPEHATLWGLARTLVQEHPELGVAAVDLDPSRDLDERTTALLLRGDASEDQCCIRDGRAFVARLEPVEIPDSVGTRVAIRGTQLVTGGFGGLGRRLCAWLLDRGAQRLVMLTRASLSADRRAWIDELRARADVHVEVVDVADREAVARVVASEGDALTGVFHLAGALDDGALLNLGPDRFATTMIPKLAGAWNLHLAVRGRSLEHFVLYGSAASLLGNPGQANYAAANAFLDGLAAHRRAAGLVATSLQWGPVAGTGMAAQTDVAAAIGSLTPQQADAALDALLVTPSAVPAAVGILPIDPSALVRALPRAATLTLLRDHVGTEPATPVAERGRLRARLSALPQARRRGELIEWLRAALAETKPLSLADIGLDTPLSDLGIDSLAGIELRGRLERELAQTLPASLLFGAPGLGGLADDLLARVELDAEPAAAGSDPPRVDGAPVPGAGALTEIELAQLDDDAAERLLFERLSQIEGGES